MVGDLSGTADAPSVVKLNGLSLPSSPPVANQVLTASSASTTTWTTPASGVVLDGTASNIQPLGTQAAGSIGKAADSGHVHTMPRLDQVAAPTASVSLNSQKAINVANPTLAQDAATKNYVDTQITASSTPDATTLVKGKVQLAGDLAGTAALPTVPGLATKANASTTISAGSGLTGGGDLSANRTISASFGVIAGTIAQGNDSRITGAVQASTATTKGDLLAATAASTITRVGVGSDTQVLTADSTQATGVKWAAPAAAPVSSVFTRTGAVTAQSGDYTAAQVGALPATNDLSAIAGANATAADVSLNSHKITNLSNGTVATDAAALGQIPVAGITAGTYAAGNDSRITGALQAGVATTKGDVLVATASATITRLPVGSDTQVLTADSTQATGVKWAAASSGTSSEATPPALSGLLAWNYDIAVTSSYVPASAGVIYYVKLIIPAISVSKLYLYCPASGVQTAGQCFVGIYDSGGSRLAITADQSSNWQSTGVKAMNLVGGPFALSAGTYYAAILTNGSNNPSFSTFNTLIGNIGNIGQTVAPFRFNKDAGGSTSLPASVTLSGLTGAGTNAYWVGLA